MTRRRLLRITFGVMAVYALAIAGAVFVRWRFPGSDSVPYNTYKDLVPLIIAIPASFLVYSFQRRNGYVSALRALWTDLIGAVQSARTYTYLPAPTAEQYASALGRLSVAIEHARGVFTNIPAPGKPDGLYPFEPIKEIHDDLRALGFGTQVDSAIREAVRNRIEVRWKGLRTQLLREFDRDVPTYHHAWLAEMTETDSKPG